MGPEYTSLISSQIALWTILSINFYMRKKRKKVIKMIKERKTGGNTEMRELAKKFINETCVVYSFDGDAKKGVIKEVSEGAILL